MIILEETRQSKRSRTLLVASMLMFIGAVLSATFLRYGIYVSLALVVLGGFSMLISSKLREESSPRKMTDDEEEVEAGAQRLPA